MVYVGIDQGSGDKTSIAVFQRDSMTVVEPPEWAGEVIGITEYNGILVVACRNAIFSYRDGALHPIRFSE